MNKSFTLMELMVVVVIIGVAASLAIPNYIKTMERSHMDDAQTQLSAIHSANTVYEARTAGYWPPDAAAYAVTDINSALRLNLIENGKTFSCTGTDGSTFTCTATRTGGSGFVMEVTEVPLSANNPTCTTNCP